MEDIHTLEVTDAACSFKAVHTLGDQEVQSMTGVFFCIAEVTQGLKVDTDGAKSGLTLPFILYYASAIHKHTHAHILKPYEDSEPTGLKVDIV